MRAKSKSIPQISRMNGGPSIKSAKAPGELPWDVRMTPVRFLKPSKNNARTHSKKQIQQVADSIKAVGFAAPIISDANGNILAGHARFEAAKVLGLNAVPVIRLSDDLKPSQLRAYMLADNKLAEKAGWDREILAVELSELQTTLPEVDLDLTITGFDPGEVDRILTDFSPRQVDPADDIPQLEQAAVSRRGDLFILGKHRLMVGDARDSASFKQLMRSESASMAFLDPPYNVKVQGHVGGRGRIKHREFACASGELSSDQFVRFLRETLELCSANLRDGAIAYVCMDWRHVGELHQAGAAAFDELKNICIWNKATPGQGSFYRSQHEFVFVYKKGSAAHLNTFELGQHGRMRSNVWTYTGANAFRANRMDELKMHPTVKPIALIADAMRDCSARGDIVLDAFAGSGSSILAAEQVGRRAYCMEIDPQYADVSIRRWQKITGKDAVLELSEQTFEELAAGAARNVSQAKSKRQKRKSSRNRSK
jgi:DNA modification methylase